MCIRDRRKIDRWDKFTPEQAAKLQVVEVKSLDELEDTQKWNTFNDCHSVFNCLGSKTSEGDAQFYKVDYTYVEWSARIGIANKIPHFSHVTTGKAAADSMFFYYRTKGQIEETLKKMKFPALTLLRPGAILNRDNDSRFIEKVFKYVPFFPKTETATIARAMRLDAERIHLKGRIDTTKNLVNICLLYTSPSPRDRQKSRMPSSA
eukprot:TRINITY_DN23693_c0_g2_i1.p1 TRINITY_DN23693_c0_g2~~TRINITY_DN23693_c0_g2_i1.p1  ORF type:complete len:225 (-),score=68.63 TRINITY_DN23693_c0_g2_i1:10-627(-)